MILRIAKQIIGLYRAIAHRGKVFLVHFILEVIDNLFTNLEPIIMIRNKL